MGKVYLTFCAIAKDYSVLKNLQKVYEKSEFYFLDRLI